MKNVLVVGDTGYIGRKFCAYKLDGLHVDGISSRHNSWKEAKLEQYSCVIYAAGMAHCKQTSENRERFFQVNTALPIEIAEHAKAAGVQQFIYLSSLSVYGMRTGVIRETDIPHPREEDAYGVSKRSAEVSLLRMSSDNFHVLIVRPPMVYGPGCRGNFQKLIKLVRILPVFPRVNNARSMIYIQNLCEFLKNAVLQNRQGIVVPQDSMYANTTEMAQLLAEAMGKKIYVSKMLGRIVMLALPYCSTLQKAFGTLIYEGENQNTEYQKVDFREAVRQSVGRETN